MSYKIMMGVVAKYMWEHTMENELWDKGQLGAVEGVLGTVDQLIIDRCIMEEVKEYHRNLAVAFYDYKKAYDKVHHDWMSRVYQWIGIPNKVIKLISQLMEKWETRLEIWSKGGKHTSRWIDISCGFLQGYQDNHETLEDVNEIIVQARHDTGACYGVEKCAEIVFERGKMVRGEGLQVLED